MAQIIVNFLIFIFKKFIPCPSFLSKIISLSGQVGLIENKENMVNFSEISRFFKPVLSMGRLVSLRKNLLLNFLTSFAFRWALT